MRRNLGLLLSGAGLEAAFLYLLGLGELGRQVPRLWAGLGLAFSAYLAAAVLLWRRPAGSLRLLLGLALLFRLTLFFSPPSLSDDIYRYVWDGRVQRAGVNPYQYPPEAPELAFLRDALYPGINHKDIPTIYPPLAQLFFRLVCQVSPTLGGMKAGLLLVEAGLILLLVRVLRQRRQDPRRVLLYAWNPLSVVEVAGSGHVDPLGICLLLLALYWLAQGRRSEAVWGLAGAFLSKLVPVLVLPVFWRHLRPPAAGAPTTWSGGRRLLPLLWLPALAGLGFAPFAGAGLQVLAGLQAYALKWRFNDSLFALCYYLFHPASPGGEETALLQAKLVCGGLLLLAVLWACWRFADPFQAAFAALGSYLLLSPTVHPWYLLWVLPFLALFPHPAWLFLSGSIFLAYEALVGYSMSGIWMEHAWVKWVEYAPFYLLLALFPLYRHSEKRPSSPD